MLFLDSIIESPMAMDFTELLPVSNFDQTLTDHGAGVATETVALMKFILWFRENPASILLFSIFEQHFL